MSKNITYHTRLYSDQSVKVVGGSFEGSIDVETVNRLAQLFEVVVKPSGTAVFVDEKRREVRLYLTVDAATTEKGKFAIQAYRKEKEAAEREEAERKQAEREEVEKLISSMSHAEIIARLRA